MLDPKLKERMTQAYAKVGDIGFSIALNLMKGKDSIPAQQRLYKQGIKLCLILEILFDHVYFQDGVNDPILYRITEVQVNKLVRWLIEIGELDKFPVAPGIIPQLKPTIVNKGVQGLQGIPGADGKDANIIVESDPTDDQIVVTSLVIDGVRHDRIKFIQYIAPILNVSISGLDLFEIGTLQDITLNISSTKGNKSILSLSCTDNSVNSILQPFVDLNGLNDEDLQPSLISITLEGESTNKTLTFQEIDTRQSISKSISYSFVYPFLYGSSDLTSINHYTALTKLINNKANLTFILNGTDKYHWIAYDSSYGDLSEIKDANGFNVIDLFTKLTITVNSSSLDNNWSQSYTIYRTTLKTTIINLPYTIVF